MKKIFQIRHLYQLQQAKVLYFILPIVIIMIISMPENPAYKNTDLQNTDVCQGVKKGAQCKTKQPGDYATRSN